MLTSRPQLFLPEDEDLLDEFQTEAAAISPRRVGLKRQIAELGGLAEMIEGLIEEAPLTAPALALYDGSLILWSLESEPEAFRMQALQEFTAPLEIARRNRVPLVGYISQPASRDVIASLRIFRCPYPKADCDRNCPHRARPKPDFVAPDCAGTERITDAELFAQRLQPGERSTLFTSRSKILEGLPPEHRILFYYLHTGPEIARIELPAWVAEDPELLALTHALCYDQARKGDGYPVALAEAHEQAIVRNAERDAFFHLLEREFVRSHQVVSATRKSLSKRARRV